MRTKVIQLVLFVVVVTVGFFVIDSFLNAAPVHCYCFNDPSAQSRCDSNCVGHGGCDYLYFDDDNDCICMYTTCRCQTYFVCMDDTLSTAPIYSYNCPDC